jgi:hypothetical protein
VPWIALYAGFLLEFRATHRKTPFQLRPFDKVSLFLGFIVWTFGVVLLSLNALSPSIASPRRYCAAMLCLLVIAGINFIGGAFRANQPPAA